ncbi:hypothetical protein BCR36DRAFT_366409 [Piromyces finnis]|uniref:Uncharacterized protein n=1 Tax=Piromyces finnis TaxID=1754191 RepID=A0A1Y1VL84_9FUNG|nr:hypothetical protein BCR36DRAFT_366409 [Piromyces finnis]|eukprot:ORX59227.1 hypothetical protein BCR36DRAFT_366409 [Piromyces finnis]
MSYLKENEIKCFDGTNFVICLGLKEYLETDKVKEAENTTPRDEAKIRAAKKNNDKLRNIIIRSISDKIHEEVISIEPVSVLIEALKTDYTSDRKDITQWIKRLKFIKTEKDSNIPKTIRKITTIYKNMEESLTSPSKKKKKLNFYYAIPPKYK